jgi:hypothetical protein
MPRLFDPDAVLETLQRLESQLHETHHHAANVAATLSAGQFSPALAAIDRLRWSVDVVVAMNTRLHANVVPVDGLGQAPESVAELAIRARRMVVVDQLDRLRDLLRETTADARDPGAVARRFRAIDSIAALFAEELHRIDALWMVYRQGDRRLDELGDHRATLYRAAVRAAHRAMLDLLDQPDVAHFLRDGIEATDWPDVHVACCQIRAALAIQIDIEPGRPGRASPRN